MLQCAHTAYCEKGVPSFDHLEIPVAVSFEDSLICVCSFTAP